MPPMTKTRARTEALYELETLQEAIRQKWLEECLPEDWDGLEYSDARPRHKTRVTIRLDSDMVRWFRNTGPGYGARINSVLRIYWTSLMAGYISAYPMEDTTPRLLRRVEALAEEAEKLK